MLFFKEYMRVDSERAEQIIQHPRFKSMYMPELIELLNDEEAYIRIEALDVMADHLDHLEGNDLESEFVKEVLRTASADVEEIQTRFAELIGKIAYRLQPFGLHVKHKLTFVDFFKLMVNHKELKMRRLAAYNLPCFNKLFKEFSEELGIDFGEIYLRFAKDDDPQIVRTIAAGIHEAFDITNEDEDS